MNTKNVPRSPFNFTPVYANTKKRKTMVSAGYQRLATQQEISNELVLTAVLIRKGIYTLQHLLENIPACYWHCRVLQQTWYRSGRFLHHCIVYTMVKDHMQCQDRRIRWLLRCCIQGFWLHCLFPPHLWCRSDPLLHHCIICKEERCGVVGQWRCSQPCLHRYIQNE